MCFAGSLKASSTVKKRNKKMAVTKSDNFKINIARKAVWYVSMDNSHTHAIIHSFIQSIN